MYLYIRYFILKDHIEKGEITIIYCPIDETIADFFTKPLQGITLLVLRKLIMGILCRDEKENGGIGEPSQ